MDQLKARSLAVRIMAAAPAVYLSTVGRDGFPETRAMLNLRNDSIYPNLARVFDEHEQDLMAYFTTNTSSSKINRLSLIQKYAFTIQNLKNGAD